MYNGNNINVPHLIFVLEGLVDFFYCEANVEDIDQLNDDHVDLEVDENRCFKIVRSFKAPLSTQETVSVEYAPAWCTDRS